MSPADAPKPDDPTTAQMAGVRRWLRFFVLMKIGLLILIAVAVWRLAT